MFYKLEMHNMAGPIKEMYSIKYKTSFFNSWIDVVEKKFWFALACIF